MRYKSIFSEIHTSKMNHTPKLIGRLMEPNLTDTNSVVKTASRDVADLCTHHSRAKSEQE